MEHQHKEAQQKIELSEDVRVAATNKIWGLCIPVLALSIPLSAITESAAIPLVALGAAAISTAAVWVFGLKGTKTTSSDPALQQRIRELEERLANLETINNFERRLAEEALAKQAAVPHGEVVKDEPSETITIRQRVTA